MAKTIYDDHYQALIAQLKAERLRRGLTQADVGRRGGKCRTWLNKIESYQIRLDILDFVRLCHVLGIEPGRLIRKLAKALK